MSYLRKPCRICGDGIDQDDATGQLVIVTADDTIRICRDCLLQNVTFRRMAASFITKVAESFGNKEEERS